jgi:PAS domain S-box-containing protein
MSHSDVHVLRRRRILTRMKEGGRTPLGDAPVRVVIADDAPEVRLLLRIALEQRGFEVVGEAGDGNEALALVVATQPELAIVDVAMPKLDGIELVRELRRQLPVLRIVVLSAYAPDKMAAAAYAAGADAYLEKSRVGGEVFETIGRLFPRTFLHALPEPSDEPAPSRADTSPLSVRELLDLVNEGVLFVDTAGTIVAANRSAADVLGIEISRLAGEHVAALPVEWLDDGGTPIHADTAGLLKAITAGSTVTGETIRIRRRDGGVRSLLVSFRPLTPQWDSDPAALISFVDVTAAKQAEEQFRGLLEAAPDAMVIVGEDGRIELVNARTEELLGYHRDELVGQPVEMLVPEHVRLGHADHRRRYAQVPKARPMGAGLSLHARCQDGSMIPVEISLSPFASEGRHLVFASVRDVRERARVESVRRRLASIIESSSDAIVAKTLAGVITDWNRAAELMYGHTAAEAIGQNVTLVIPPERAGEQEWIFDRLRRGERIEHFETVRIRRDGGRIDVSLTVSPIHDAQGMLVGAATIARDVTERRRAEQALAASEERFRKVFEEGPVGVCVVGADFRFVRVNAALAAMLGSTSDELVGATFADLASEPGDGLEIDLARRLFVGDIPRYQIEKRWLRGDGSDIWVKLNVSVLRDEEGRPLQGIVLVEDITEQRAVESVRRELDALKDTFVQTVAHDLRSPLSAIRGLAQLLEDDEVEPALRQNLAGRIAGGADRLLRLVSDLLDTERIRSGNVELQREPTDLSAVLRAVADHHEDNDHKIVVDAVPTIASVDPTHVERIVENLVGNAVRHTPEGTTVWLQLAHADDSVVVSVVDDGPGIPDELKSSVFEPFFKGTRLGGGFGVGLSLVARLAELHGGRAWVDDRVGGGSAFHVTFPLVVTPSPGVPLS